MDKKQIKKYAANGMLAATLIAGIGSGIHDHTEKVTETLYTSLQLS